MSLRRIFKTAFCFTALLISTNAQASVIDLTKNYNGYDLDLGMMQAGQSGRIDNFASALSHKGFAEGLLPPQTRITFTYHPSGVFPSSNDVTSMLAQTSSRYDDADNNYSQFAAHHYYHFVQGSNVMKGYMPLSAATKNDNYVGPATNLKANVSHLTLTAIIENTSKVAAYFSSFIQNTYGAGVNGYASYSVSSVPLPAALPLFGMGLLALGVRRKFKKKPTA